MYSLTWWICTNHRDVSRVLGYLPISWPTDKAERVQKVSLLITFHIFHHFPTRFFCQKKSGILQFATEIPPTKPPKVSHFEPATLNTVSLCNKNILPDQIIHRSIKPRGKSGDHKRYKSWLAVARISMGTYVRIPSNNSNKWFWQGIFHGS